MHRCFPEIFAKPLRTPKKASTIDKKLNDMNRAGSYITQKLRVTITTDKIAPYN